MSRGGGRPPGAALLFAGTELLGGQPNTHQPRLCRLLREDGWDIVRAETLPDDARALADSLRRAARDGRAVIVCGGLGPTFDDLTREAAAEAFDLPLAFRAGLWRRIARRLRSLPGGVIPAGNRRQAMVLGGARVLPNPNGSAPGQSFSVPGPGGKPCQVFLLPGPASEMVPMFERFVRPVLRRLAGSRPESLTLRLGGLPESAADERLSGVRARWPDAEFTILASGPEVSFHALLRGPSARARRELLRRDALEAVGAWVYGEGEESLEAAAGALLRLGGNTLAVAESCTGGGLGARLTAAPGASDYFLGGVLAYSNEAKRARLGVPAPLLRRAGAVSGECAAAMAEGARRAFGASVAVSVTGIAGPAGGSPAKPVGLVYVAVAGPGRRAAAREHRLRGGREEIRRQAASRALLLLVEVLRGASLDAGLRVS